MTNRYLTPDQEAAFDEVLAQVRVAQDALSGAVLKLMLALPPDDPRTEAAIALVESAEEALRGLPYRLHPQAEWMGGPVETAVYKARWPHL